MSGCQVNYYSKFRIKSELNDQKKEIQSQCYVNCHLLARCVMFSEELCKNQADYNCFLFIIRFLVESNMIYDFH